MDKKTKSEAVEAVDNKFTKEQLLKSKRYKNMFDVVNALLKPDEQYTFNQVDDMIDKFMKGVN